MHQDSQSPSTAARAKAHPNLRGTDASSFSSWQIYQSSTDNHASGLFSPSLHSFLSASLESPTSHTLPSQGSQSQTLFSDSGLWQQSFAADDSQQSLQYDIDPRNLTAYFSAAGPEPSGYHETLALPGFHVDQPYNVLEDFFQTDLIPPKPPDAHTTTSPSVSPSVSRSTPSNTPTSTSTSRIEKRTKNTLAARRYRQKRLDQLSELEAELKETRLERDALKVRLAKLEGETEILRQLVQKK